VSAPEITLRGLRLAEHIEQKLTAELIAHPRVASLPEMILRHGVLQTAAFLQSKREKTKQDGELLSLLDGCVRQIVPGIDLCGALGPLSKLVIDRYMLVNEVAVEAAAWIGLLANARKASAPVNEGT